MSATWRFTFPSCRACSWRSVWKTASRYTLRKDLPELLEPARNEAQSVLDLEEAMLYRFRSIIQYKISAMRIRCHGDYHLGEVLYTGDDFVIFDFEGDPDRPVLERRLKRSPLLDVASMLRSFQYATYVARLSRAADAASGWQEVAALEPWARFWSSWVSAAFLRDYLATAAQGALLPTTREELCVLLDALLLERAIYELGYELNNRPSWVRIPLQGILQLLKTGA